MIIILSPAKKLDYSSNLDPSLKYSIPKFLNESEFLIDNLKKIPIKKISSLMKLSPKLAELNFDRYHSWAKKHTRTNSRQSILSFNGAAYLGLDAKSLNKEDLLYSQEHLRILSGLYGILKPLDLLQEYRLEMGTRLKTSKGKNLYEFWGDKLIKSLQKDIDAKEKILINLASNEYSKAVKLNNLDARVITCNFKDMSKSGEYKTIMTYAKTARGLMTRFIIKNKITNPERLLAFDYKRYFYSKENSSENLLTFLRG